MSDLFKINWLERAKNDPVVQYLFKDYIFEKDHLKQETKTPVNIKDNAKKTTKKLPKSRKKDGKVIDKSNKG